VSDETFTDVLLDDGPAANDEAGDGIADPVVELNETREESLAAFAARGDLHRQLVDEVLQATAEREAAAAAKAGFASAEAAAVAEDDLPTQVLGRSLQEDFADAMRLLDDGAYAELRSRVQAQGSKDRSEGGQGWTENGPRGGLSDMERAILNRHLAERVTDPAQVLAQVQKRRAEQVEAELRRNPAAAELHGLAWSLNEGRFVAVAPSTRDASRLSAGEIAALGALAKGQRVEPPAGHTAETWRKLAAAWVLGERA
jgi:hypothetical protein